MMSLSLSAICLIALTNHVSFWTTGPAVAFHSMVTSSEPLPQGKTAKRKRPPRKKKRQSLRKRIVPMSTSGVRIQITRNQIQPST